MRQDPPLIPPVNGGEAETEATITAEELNRFDRAGLLHRNARRDYKIKNRARILKSVCGMKKQQILEQLGKEFSLSEATIDWILYKRTRHKRSASR